MVEAQDVDQDPAKVVELQALMETEAPQDKVRDLALEQELVKVELLAVLTHLLVAALEQVQVLDQVAGPQVLTEMEVMLQAQALALDKELVQAKEVLLE